MELTTTDITIILSVLDAWIDRRTEEFLQSNDPGLSEAISNMEMIVVKLEAKVQG